MTEFTRIKSVDQAAFFYPNPIWTQERGGRAQHKPNAAELVVFFQKQHSHLILLNISNQFSSKYLSVFKWNM